MCSIANVADATPDQRCALALLPLSPSGGVGGGGGELRGGGGGRVRDVLHFAARCLGSWMCGGLGIRDLGQGLGPLSEFVDIWGARMDGFVCGE